VCACDREEVGREGSRKLCPSQQEAISRQIFDALPDEERKKIADRAKAVSEQAKAAYTQGLKQTPATTPEARQAYVVCLQFFVQLANAASAAPSIESRILSPRFYKKYTMSLGAMQL
jgi:hypothetical protein